jgi:hypothetical protein
MSAGSRERGPREKEHRRGRQRHETPDGPTSTAAFRIGVDALTDRAPARFGVVDWHRGEPRDETMDDQDPIELAWVTSC